MSSKYRYSNVNASTDLIYEVRNIEKTLRQVYRALRKNHGPNVDPNLAVIESPWILTHTRRWIAIHAELWAKGETQVLTWNESLWAGIEQRQPTYQPMED